MNARKKRKDDVSKVNGSYRNYYVSICLLEIWMDARSRTAKKAMGCTRVFVKVTEKDKEIRYALVRWQGREAHPESEHNRRIIRVRALGELEPKGSPSCFCCTDSETPNVSHRLSLCFDNGFSVPF